MKSQKPLRPSGQFYVTDIGEFPVADVPVDNFYWKTNRGLEIRLTAHAGLWYVDVGRKGHRKAGRVKSVGDGLRLMADILEKQATNKH